MVMWLNKDIAVLSAIITVYKRIVDLEMPPPLRLQLQSRVRKIRIVKNMTQANLWMGFIFSAFAVVDSVYVSIAAKKTKNDSHNSPETKFNTQIATISASTIEGP